MKQRPKLPEPIPLDYLKPKKTEEDIEFFEKVYKIKEKMRKDKIRRMIDAEHKQMARS